MFFITCSLVPKLIMPLSRAAVADGLDEFLLGERFQAVDQRRADHAFLVGAVAAVAGRGAPGAKPGHGEGIHLVAFDDRVGLVRVLRGGAGREQGERDHQAAREAGHHCATPLRLTGIPGDKGDRAPESRDRQGPADVSSAA
jgi:hypothetical protein